MSRFSTLLLVMASGCNAPNQTHKDAFTAAKRQAAERGKAHRAAFEASVEDLRHGKWAALEDGEPCLELPVSAREPEAWVVDSPMDTSAAGWLELPNRVFELPLEGRDSLSHYDDADELMRRVKQLNERDPTKAPNLVILYVDSLERPKVVDDKTFLGGRESGRAWVWSQSAKTVVCSGRYASTTPEEVRATYLLDSRHRGAERDSALMLALRRNSIEQAYANMKRLSP